MHMTRYKLETVQHIKHKTYIPTYVHICMPAFKSTYLDSVEGVTRYEVCDTRHHTCTEPFHRFWNIRVCENAN